MLRIGLTGGIGAGKSTVSTILSELGAAIIDADLIAREVVAPGEPLLDELVAAFGPQVIAGDGSLDRARLATAAFVDTESTARLNALMHPAIRNRTAEQFARYADTEVVVHDVPLLVENHMAPGYHLTLLVDVPAEVRLHRLIASRGMDPTDAQARIARQADDTERYAASDVIIDNSGTPGSTVEAVRALWNERIAPFAAHLRRGVSAAHRAPSGSHSTTADAARLRARLVHWVPSAAEVEVAVEDQDGLRAVIVPGIGTTVDMIGGELAAIGFFPLVGAVPSFATADPGAPARVHVRGKD